MENLAVHNHFPICVLENKVSNELADSVEKKLLPYIEGLPEEGGHLHTDYFTQNKLNLLEEVPELFEFLLETKRMYQQITAFKARDIPEMVWLQDYRSESAVHGKHVHGVSGISGVYWIRANDKAGPLRIYNPNVVLEYLAKYDNFNPYTTMSNDYYPEKGKLILFPSYLHHEVMPSLPGVVRTTIAYNYLSPDVNLDGIS